MTTQALVRVTLAALVSLGSLCIGSSARSEEAQGVDLRPLFAQLKIAPRAQGSRGACQVCAFLGPAEFLLAKQHRQVELSPQFLMWAANRAGDLQLTEGFNPDLLLRGLQEYGVCEESLMPYVPRNEPIEDSSPSAVADAAKRRRFTFRSIKHWSTPIGFGDDELQAIRDELNQAQPVTATFCWPFGLSDDQIVDKNHFLIDRGIDGDNKSGHGVVLVGYRPDNTAPGGGYFILLNSWGATFAAKGFAKIDYAMARKYGTDAYLVTLD